MKIAFSSSFEQYDKIMFTRWNLISLMAVFSVDCAEKKPMYQTTGKKIKTVELIEGWIFCVELVK